MTMHFPDALGRLFAKRPPHPILQSIRAGLAGFDQNARLEDVTFTVLDTELTGLDHRRDEIVSLGAVRIRNMTIQPADSFYSLVKPSKLPKVSTLVHRITPSEVRSAPPLEAVLPDFVEFLGPTLLVGHHIGLDMGFLNRACTGILDGKLANPCLDTLLLARIYEEERWINYYDRFDTMVSYTLADLGVRYGIPSFTAHHALTDALQTAHLFMFLVRKLRQGGVTTLRDLHALGRSWRWYF